MTEMTPRERMMTAMRGGIPDRVPSAPDISNMIPCRLTGKPFYEIYANDNPNLADAYLHALDVLPMDGWYTYGGLRYHYPEAIERKRDWISRGRESWRCRDTICTPAGNLSETTVFPAGNPPTTVEKMIKNLKEDFPKYRYLYQLPDRYDDTRFQEYKAKLGEKGVMCIPINPPGLHLWSGAFDGSLEAATYAYYDMPEIFEELRELHERQALRQLEMALDRKVGVDSILTGGSGSITLQSPEIWRKLSLPTLKKITRMCREAGVISGIHSCGIERILIETCCRETDLDYVNPLEEAPMGDCVLKEIRDLTGGKLCLMGNLHTVNTMLNGSVELVRLRSLEAIRDAGQNGGFILSTADQCGRDTPLENIAEMNRTVREFGQYPLNMEKIQKEIDYLQKNVANSMENIV